MDRMRAVTRARYGSPEALTLAEVPRPVPGRGEVLVRVHRASVNSWDWDMLCGHRLLVRLTGGGIFRPSVRILGADIAGEVAQVGPGVSDWANGDRVFGDLSSGAWGGFAEFAVAQVSELARIPDSVTFDEAAALPQAGLLALQGLRDVGQLKKGHKVLINGAGGGVGTLGIQIAQEFGAHVTAVDSADKLERLHLLGATECFDFRLIDYRDFGPWDVILDNVMQHRPGAYRRALEPHGIFVFVGGDFSHLPETLAFHLLTRQNRRVRILALKQSRTDLDILAEMVADGRLRPVIGAVYGLADTPAALSALGAGTHFGKLVIDCTR